MSDWHNKNTQKQTAWNVRQEKAYPKDTLRNRINFNPTDFDNAIKMHGVKVKVYRSMFCPNVKSTDGAEHDIDCQIPGCNGSGFVDRHPIETMAIIQTQQLENQPLPEGSVDGNSVAATFLSGIELQYFTLVELCDFTEIFFQRVLRSDSDTDHLKYRAQRVNMVLDQYNKEFYQCIDFSIDPNGNIIWKENRGPAPGTIYSAHYETAVQFRAIRAMHNNRFGQVKDGANIKHVKFQEQWMLQKEYLVKRTDKDGNEIQPNSYQKDE